MSDSVDVFLSYAHGDRPAARQLAEALQAQGLQVWWDRHLAAGSEFAQEIEDRLQTAQVVVGLWSADSVRSAFVRDECGRALRAGKLLPLRIEAVDLPLGFGQSHTLDLIDWDGDIHDEAFAQLLAEIRQHKGQPVDVASGPRGLAWGNWSTRRRYWKKTVLVIGVACVAAGAWWSLAQRQADILRGEADRHFRAGLAHQFAKEPELVGALNEYLSTLELQPKHARAQYYLAHVYVQNGRPDDALAAFRRALSLTEAPLDASLGAEARKQIAALSPDPAEAAPVVRKLSADALVAALGGGKAGATRGFRPAQPQAGPAPPATGATPPPPPPAAAEAKSAPVATPAATPARRPVRVEASPEQLAALTLRVDGMFDRDRDRRVAATTGLIVEAAALSDAVPLALRKALAVFQAAHGEPLVNPASSGLVNTLVLLRAASPATLQANRDPIGELLEAARSQGDTTREQAAGLQALLDQSASRRPVVYLQIANEGQRPLAEALERRFTGFGYEVPGIELVRDQAPARSEVRSQGKSESGLARWVLRVVGEMGGQPAKLSTLRNARPSTDTYEVWLGRDICAEGPPAGPGCKGTAQ